MDFDDLDEEIEARVAAGDVELDEQTRQAMGILGAEPPGPWNGECLSRMSRSIQLPGRMNLPEKVRDIMKADPASPQYKMRLLGMYGGGDSFVMWGPCLSQIPQWLEVGLHEYPGHGLRDEEPHPKDLFELAEDCWNTFEPVLKQHAKGGLHEGALFALLSHSQGILQMIEVAERAYRLLGLRPCAVFALDRPPPGPMGLTEFGYNLLTQPWMDEFYLSNGQYSLGKMLKEQKHVPSVQKMGYMWQNDMRISNEGHTQREVGFHTLKCDVYVFIAMTNWGNDKAFAEAKAKGDDEQIAFFTKMAKIQGSKGDSCSYFDREAYDLWGKWTTGKVHYHEIDVSHNDMKNDKSTWDIIAKALQEQLQLEEKERLGR